MATGTTTSPAPQTSSRTRQFLLFALLLCIVGVTVYYYLQSNNEAPDESMALRGYLQEGEKYAKLAEGLVDADGDLVADPPKDGKFLEPKELVFMEVAGHDVDNLALIWEPFRKHLADKTGLPVKYLKATPPDVVTGEDATTVDSFNQQIELMTAGKLHIAAFSTGQVPMAVNVAGFVPTYAPATADGVHHYDMEVIVPADSSVKDVAGLRGKTVAFVSLSSNSGAKAPIVLFYEKYGLLVAKDYKYTPSGTHEMSIFGVCVGRDAAAVLANPDAEKSVRAEAMAKPGNRYDAACVANDILARLVARGEIQPGQYRSIFKAGPFPALCFGHAHNLKPELVAKIREAFETFSFKGNSVGTKYEASNRVKFTKVDYKKDWQTVRDINDKLPGVIQSK